jgi:hypothetical protein
MIPLPPDEYTLDILFRGICSHFHNDALPAIPHRVVLPEASILVPGLLTGPLSVVKDGTDPLNWLRYLLCPHFPYVAMVNEAAINVPIKPFLTVNGVMLDGAIYTSTRLIIMNVLDTSVTYPRQPKTPLKGLGNGPFTDLHSLNDYVANYTFSSNVVLGGRAAAYFDFYGGEITSFSQGDALGAHVRVTTSGPPQLRVAPLAIKDLPRDVQTIPLTTDPNQLHSTMVVGNSGLSCGSADFDFILHYLTSASGIPRAVTEPLPGMFGPTIDGQELPNKIEELLKDIEKLARAGGFDRFGPKVKDIMFIGEQASCSGSRYP